MSDFARVEWTETATFHAYVKLPDDCDGGSTFDPSDYDLANGMAEFNEDIHHEGTDREIDSVQRVPPAAVPPNEEIEEPDWESWRI